MKTILSMSSVGNVSSPYSPQSPQTEASVSSGDKKHVDGMKSDDTVSHYASIELSIENINIKLHHDHDDESVSAHSIEIREVPYHKAVPNKWRPNCKHHFHDFWNEYFFMLFDQDVNNEYKHKFVELKIDDIRCIPFIHMKHLLNHVHMLKEDAKKAFQMIQKFKRNNEIFFSWVSNKCQCEKYIPNFEDAGILTWKTFAKSIVSKSDLKDIIPQSINNDIDRKVLWSNIPNDIWDHYHIDRRNTPMSHRKRSLHTIFPSAVNLRADISWNFSKKRETPQKHVEYLWIGFLSILLVFDVLITVFLVTNDTIPYFNFLVNNILNTMHFIVQLILILSWMEWLVFVHMNGWIKCMQWMIELLLCLSTLFLLFNISIYILHFVLGKDDDFIANVSKLESNKFCRNTWFILNGLAFICILTLIGFVSVKRICKEEIKHLALRKEGENDIVKNDKESGALCRYCSLTIVRYLMLTMFLNMLMFVQTGVWLYWRYIEIPSVTHHEVKKKYEFKLAILSSDILCVLGGILLTFYLRKQRINYEAIKEMNHSKRKFDANSSFDSMDLHGLTGVNTNRDSPIL
eukprot:358693_1